MDKTIETPNGKAKALVYDIAVSGTIYRMTMLTAEKETGPFQASLQMMREKTDMPIKVDPKK